jgi:hypothetical protein
MDFSKQPSTQAYSQEDVREILDIAMADRSTLDPDLSYSQWEYLKVAKIDQSPQNKGLSHTSKA